MIAAHAAQPHGLVTLDQLKEMRLAKSSVYARVDAGRLHLVKPGVFAVGHRLLSEDGERLAAVLSLGEDAALSHVSAAIAWELVHLIDTRWHVAVPHSSGGITGAWDVRPRRTRRLLAEDRTTLRGVPITTVERTLLDTAGERGGMYIRETVHEAEVLGLLDVPAVPAAIERNPGRRGTKLPRGGGGGGATAPP